MADLLAWTRANAFPLALWLAALIVGTAAYVAIAGPGALPNALVEYALLSMTISTFWTGRRGTAPWFEAAVATGRDPGPDHTG